MSEREIYCHLRLRHSDLVMQNHRVHGTAVLPGVVLLDTALRILAARGHDPAGFALERILFTEPIATDPSIDRELRVQIVLPAEGSGSVIVASRAWETDTPFRQNLQAVLSIDQSPAKASLDIQACRDTASAGLDMSELYRRARIEEIDHGPKMRCVGQLWIGPAGLVAELALEVDTGVGFHMHPAALDATTIAAFGQTGQASQDPFIPVTIGRFRALRSLPSPFVLHAPRVEVLAVTGDVISNDYDLYDTEGRHCASIQKLTCKRIRSRELITRLLLDSAPAVAPNATEAPPSQASSYREMRQLWIAESLKVEPSAVLSHVGFYDLGLDSRSMLALAARLEAALGRDIYPTLLFEYPNIDALDEHLLRSYGPLGKVLEAVRPEQKTHPTMLAEAMLATPRWVRDARPAGRAADSRRVLTVGLDARQQLELREGGGVHQFRAAELGPEAELGTTPQVDGVVILLDEFELLASDTVLSKVLAWTRAAARCGRDLDVLLIEQGAQPSPAFHGLAAFARCVRTETPRVACRALLAPRESWASAVLAELERTTDTFGATAGMLTADQTGQAFVQILARGAKSAASAGLPLSRGAVCVVAGGSGGIGRRLADWLVSELAARVVLLSRTAPDATVLRSFRQRAGMGSIEHRVCDITEPTAVLEVMRQVRREHGGIEAVFHLAGALSDALHFAVSPAQIEAVVRPKVAGFDALDMATAQDKLSLFVIFSSLAAWRPNPGQGVYAFANATVEAMATRRRARGDRSGLTVAMAWPLWADGGMQLSEAELESAMNRTGLSALPTAVALDCLRIAVSTSDGPDRGSDGLTAVLYGDLARVSSWIVSEDEPVLEPLRARAVQSDPIADVGSARRNEDEIAIIGLAGRYPDASDIDELWVKLCAGHDAISEIPSDRWDHAAVFDARKGVPGKTYGRWGGFLEDIDAFDAKFFHISRRDAERMDPQERLFLQTCWTLLEAAGHPARTLTDRNVGVFAGVMWNHYQLCQGDDVAPTAMHAAVANRVSFALDLHGPSLAVDTACSSSLTALSLAVDALRAGSCSMAIAGGVNLSVHPEKYRQLSMGQFLSEDGRCRSFGEGGTGYVPGEGVGAVLLRRLSDALADGDHVWGVIKGSATNHTGRTAGFTVPSPVGQTAVIRRALESGGVDPASISYVEAHGTGTALGDPIEIEGLSRALAVQPNEPIAIGSIKSNIGHLEGAAGIAAVTKVLLMLRHRMLVPSLHAERLNPALTLATLGLHVQRELAPWPEPKLQRPRRAAISAFGAGGSNAHVIVEEAPRRSLRAIAPSEQLLVLSARDRAGLRDYARRLGCALLSQAAAPVSSAALDASVVVAELLGVSRTALQPEDTLRALGLEGNDLNELARRANLASAPHPDTELGQLSTHDIEQVEAPMSLLEVAYTLQRCRTHLAERVAVVTGSLAEAGRLLSAWADEPQAPAVLLGACTSAQTARSGVQLLVQAAEAWVNGAATDFSQAWSKRSLRKLPLPVPLLGSQKFWIGAWRTGQATEAITPVNGFGAHELMATTANTRPSEGGNASRSASNDFRGMELMPQSIDDEFPANEPVV
ncbi:MAG: Beta-ketoacyl synthase, partial [Myxococcaceae bacterium]|nr:Beta-ketoacyl synthase [Myxococcaceae bacterium]